MTLPSKHVSVQSCKFILVGVASLIISFVVYGTFPPPLRSQQSSANSGVTDADNYQQAKPHSSGYTNLTYDPAKDPRIGKPDSIRYYGPGRTWQYWESAGLFEQETWKKGRDTWWFFTAGNERFYRALSVKLGKFDVSVDFFRLLDTRNRANRFNQLGLINEPNFRKAGEPDEYGLWLDVPVKTNGPWKSDGRYPADGYYPKQEEYESYGLPTGIVGLRLFHNPSFTSTHEKEWKSNLKKWNEWSTAKDEAVEEPINPLAEYFKNPGKTEPPYLVGITCALCHVAFDPTNPPKDPAEPRWENLSANIGNQYFREGDLFFGWGRVNGGDANPTDEYLKNPFSRDPFKTNGLAQCGVNKLVKRFPGTELAIFTGPSKSSHVEPYITNGQYYANVPKDLHEKLASITVGKASEILREAPAGRGKQHLSNLLYHYGQTQESGTSETSRFSYDFINNPNTINKLFFVANRPRFMEEAPNGKQTQTLHVLKDGADSVGIPAALSRVYVNIGAEAEYWLSRLWNPLEGTGPHPLSIAEMTFAETVPEWRKQELRETIPMIGQDWKRIEARMPALATYLTSYNSPFLLEDAVNRSIMNLAKDADYETKKERLEQLRPGFDPQRSVRNGKRMFATYCACCHSNKQPTYPLTDEDAAAFFKKSVFADDFLVGNTLTNDVRHPVTQIDTNSQRAFATNAIDGEIWAEFSSRDYKALPSVGTLLFETPLNQISPRYGNDPIKTSFVAPGGGRGYYRTASLVSLWATAPYLHNNSVGKEPFRRFDFQSDDPFNAQTGFDNQVFTVETRMELFQDGIEKMLGLRPRDGVRSIKLTYAEASLLSGFDQAKARITANAIADTLGPMVEQIVAAKLNNKVESDSVRTIVQAALTESFSQAREQLPELLDNVNFKSDAKKLWRDVAQIIKPYLTAFIEQKIETQLSKALASAELPAGLSNAIVEVVEEIDFGDLIEGIDGVIGAGPVNLFFTEIPRGTPLNLILNQNIKKVPYAVQALLLHKDDPRALAEALLKLSDCPDIVEDHGHHFPTAEQRANGEFDDDDLKDLIEFLKTL